ncbi:hypothetical protein GCM10009530_76210 [Microbispora corallina]|uniref:Uncharacterized protein n=1 Tax=Microbispora corallina TaxID=83302 RepID=A0ABQ4GBK3_9ACTN|nr:hypothetical protein Mco01_74640 [Microbispora corallina]
MNIGEIPRRAGVSRGTGPYALTGRWAGPAEAGGPRHARTSPRPGTSAPAGPAPRAGWREPGLR